MLKNAAQKAVSSTKNFVADHKVALTIVATATTTVVAMRALTQSGLKEAYQFIEDKGLMEDFKNSTNVFDA